MSDVFSLIEKTGIIPVVVLDRVEDAEPLASALIKGGLPCAEVTFRTAAAEESIRIMSKKFPEMLIGAGTVLTTEQVDKAIAAGAKFIVSPGTNPKVVRYCNEKNIPIIGEIQATGSGVGTVELQRFPCPTLVYRQISILDKLPTLVGIKEHFGIAFSRIGVNTLFLKEFFKNPEASLSELLESTAAYYGKQAAPYLIEAWKECEKGIDLLPYSFTYAYSNIACFKAKHDYHFPKVSCVHADTPAWESDRRCGFFLTHDQQYHPWALENAALLFKQSSAKFLKVKELYEKALSVCTERKDDLAEALSDVNVMYRANMGQYLHFTEALTAVDARIALFQQNGGKLKNICEKFQKLLDKDLELNPGDADVIKELEDFKKDPKLYFDTRFRQEEHFYGETYVTKVDQRY